MTLREAKRLWREWKDSPNIAMQPEEIEAVDTMERALERPTRLEQRARRLMLLMTPHIKGLWRKEYLHTACERDAWMKDYDRKRKVAR